MPHHLRRFEGDVEALDEAEFKEYEKNGKVKVYLPPKPTDGSERSESELMKVFLKMPMRDVKVFSGDSVDLKKV